MAKAGIPVPIIQLFGRWGSDIVLQYIRDSALGEKGGDIAKQISAGFQPAANVPLLQAT